jgi:tRNA-dihydrouridine synthase
VKNSLLSLPKPFFALAPMDDVTDAAFRRIVADCTKPDLFFTEFVNVDGLQSIGRQKLLHRLEFSNKEQPIFAQIWGKDPKNYQKTAKELVKMGFTGIDINMGCPDKAVVKSGCCSALINNRPLAAEIIAATKQGAKGKVPVSVKLRIGFNSVDLTWPQFVLEQKVDLLTIHGRTTKQMSKVPNDWSSIKKVRQIRDKIAPKTLIMGNGDIKSREQGEKLAKKYGLDGVMIGRGIFNNPYVFAPKSKWQNLSPADKIVLYIKHIELFKKIWAKGDKNPASIKKFAKIYINDFKSAKDLRHKLVRQNSLDDMLNILNNALNSSI